MEIFYEIPGFYGYYQIIKSGIVKSVERYANNKNQHRLLKERILTPHSYNGYFSLIMLKDGKRSKQKLHRLLAITFIPNPFNKPFINHIDGNPSNNNISNLEWCTPSENTQHAYDIGLMPSRAGKNNPMFGIRGKDAPNFGKVGQGAKKVIDTRTGKIYNSGSEAARLLGFSKPTLHHKLNGISKNDTTLKYI